MKNKSTPPPVPTAPPPPIARAVVASHRASFASRLLVAEHDRANLQADLDTADRQIEQLKGAMSACDALEKHKETPAQA